MNECARGAERFAAERFWFLGVRQGERPGMFHADQAAAWRTPDAQHKEVSQSLAILQN